MFREENITLPATLPPSSRLAVTIAGDEATVEISFDKGSDESQALIDAAVRITEALAAKRLAFWNPIEEFPE